MKFLNNFVDYIKDRPLRKRPQTDEDLLNRIRDPAKRLRQGTRTLFCASISVNGNEQPLMSATVIPPNIIGHHKSDDPNKIREIVASAFEIPGLEICVTRSVGSDIDEITDGIINESNGDLMDITTPPFTSLLYP